MAKILLVEPDKILADTYSQALTADGHEVTVSAGAQTAVQAADSIQPDIAIVELQLVEHSGIEFLYEFRSYSDWKNIPVIIHSQVPLNEFQDNFQIFQAELNIAAYLYKPQTSLTQLLAAVNEALLPVRK